MTKPNKNIDDLFKLARSERPIVSREGARNLINSGARPESFGLIDILKNLKGIKPMYSIPAISSAAAIVAAIILSPFFPAMQSNENEKTKEPIVVEVPDKGTENIKPIGAAKEDAFDDKIAALREDEKIDDDKNLKEYISSKYPESELSVEGVNVIKLSDEELEKLGFVKEGDSFKFVALGETKYPMSIKLSPTELRAVSGSKDMGGGVSATPRFVTDGKGARKLSFLTDDSEGAFMSAFFSGSGPITYFADDDSEGEVSPGIVTEMVSPNNESGTAYLVTYDENKDDKILSKIVLRSGSTDHANIRIDDLDESYAGLFKVRDPKNSENNDEAKKVIRKNLQFHLDDIELDEEELAELEARIQSDVLSELEDLPYFDEEKMQFFSDSLNAALETAFDNPPNFNEDYFMNLDSSMKFRMMFDWNSLDSANQFISFDGHNFVFDSEELDSILKANAIFLNGKLNGRMKYIDSVVNNSLKSLGSSDINFDFRIDGDCDDHDEISYFYEDNDKIYTWNSDSTATTKNTVHPNGKYSKTIVMSNRIELDDSNSASPKKVEIHANVVDGGDGAIRLERKIVGDATVDKRVFVFKPIVDYVEVNKLVPIEIALEKDAKYILWFEATEDLLEKLPERYRSELAPEIAAAEGTSDFCDAGPIKGEENFFDVWRACSGSLENMEVFPNPTNGPVGISYELKDSRDVSFAVHDVYGRRLFELGAKENQAPGGYTENFDISDLTAGMYLIVARTDRGEQTALRIILE